MAVDPATNESVDLLLLPLLQIGKQRTTTEIMVFYLPIVVVVVLNFGSARVVVVNIVQLGLVVDSDGRRLIMMKLLQIFQPQQICQIGHNSTR